MLYKNVQKATNCCLFQVKVVTGKDGQAVTPVAIATQLPANVSAAFSVQPQFQVKKATLIIGTYYNATIALYIFFLILNSIENLL